MEPGADEERETAGRDTVENQIKRLGQSRNVLLPASSPALSSDLLEMMKP